MEQLSFEGTWEDILRHAPELTGRRVRLTVLSNETAANQQTTLDQLLKDRVGQVQFQPSNLSTRTKEAFADIVTDKYKLPELEQ